MSRLDPTALPAWAALQALAAEPVDLRRAFAADPDRARAMRASAAGLTLDLSRQCLSREALALLLELAEQAGVPERRAAMAAGEAINTTENRAVLHLALRRPVGETLLLDGRDVVADVHGELAKMGQIAADLHETGLYDQILSIGIGGSDLGPRLFADALAPLARPGLTLRFVSNVDPQDLAIALTGLDPRRTLVVIQSKTFTTQETMANARAARDWLVAGAGEAAVARQMLAVSTNAAGVAEFGLDPERGMLRFWDWVGGRTSVWSAIGLPVVLLTGIQVFRRVLAGAHAMDQHFLSAEPGANLPLLMGLAAIWNRNFLNLPGRAVLPYDQRLSRLPAFLQQLDMESNGKRVTRDGEPVRWATGPLVFGEAGTNGQHSFYQHLHHGDPVTPVEILLRARPGAEPAAQHRILLAHGLAQARAFAFGRTLEEATAEAGPDLAPHKVFPGNRPVLMLGYQDLTPEVLGALIAFYEHAVFVQGVIWGINSFDQMGVELGKKLAADLLPRVEASLEGAFATTDGLDAASAAWLDWLRPG